MLTEREAILFLERFAQLQRNTVPDLPCADVWEAELLEVIHTICSSTSLPQVCPPSQSTSACACAKVCMHAGWHQHSRPFVHNHVCMANQSPVACICKLVLHCSSTSARPLRFT